MFGYSFCSIVFSVC